MKVFSLSATNTKTKTNSPLPNLLLPSILLLGPRVTEATAQSDFFSNSRQDLNAINSEQNSHFQTSLDALNSFLWDADSRPANSYMRGSDTITMIKSPRPTKLDPHPNMGLDLDMDLEVTPDSPDEEHSAVLAVALEPNSQNQGEDILSPTTQNFQQLTIALEALLDGLSSENGVLKAFTGEIGQTIDKINNYGCWCYFGERHGHGRGQPQDPIDQVCKVLHDGYECILRDDEDEKGLERGSPGSCVPWEVDYVPASGTDPDLTLPQECKRRNRGHDCATRACIVEGNFIRGLLAAFMSGNDIDETLKHTNGFDPNTKCRTAKKATSGHFGKACCGHYPDRFPYRTSDGDRKCCGQRTYNAVTLKCCDQRTSTVKFNC